MTTPESGSLGPRRPLRHFGKIPIYEMELPEYAHHGTEIPRRSELTELSLAGGQFNRDIALAWVPQPRRPPHGASAATKAVTSGEYG